MSVLLGFISLHGGVRTETATSLLLNDHRLEDYNDIIIVYGEESDGKGYNAYPGVRSPLSSHGRRRLSSVTQSFEEGRLSHISSLSFSHPGPAGTLALRTLIKFPETYVSTLLLVGLCLSLYLPVCIRTSPM